jgi:probable rRNA maturation factor
MILSVDVVDDTGLVADQEAVRRLVHAVLAAEGASGEVAVAFVDETVIAELNARYRGEQGSTDVLSFDYVTGPHWPGEAGTGGVAGEIVVCPEVVVRYAGEEHCEPGNQLGWTLIHGALHLAGYDHETDDGEMRERELELLNEMDALVRLVSLEPRHRQ